MFNLFLAYSDTDAHLGRYFSDCADDLKYFLLKNFPNAKIHEINKEKLCYPLFDLEVEKTAPVVVTAFSHGSADELFHNGQVYLKKQNASSFQNTLFYTNACSAGLKLGHILIEAGCLSFIGYKNEVFVVIGHYDKFRDCDNHGIKCFLQGDSTGTAFEKMKSFYTEKIDELYSDDAFASAILMRNRDSLVIIGSRDLDITAFVIDSQVNTAWLSFC